MFTESYKNEGVLLGESFGVPYPEAFEHPLNEYRALTSTAALIDLCHWAVIRLTGEDRVRLLNALTTNDVSSLAPGEAHHSALATAKGKLVAELFVLMRESDIVVLASQGDPRAVRETIEKHIIADDVELEDVSNRFGVLSVEGPRSRQIVWRLFPDRPIPDERFRFVEADYLGTPVTILHNNVSGERGYQLIVRADGIRLMRNYLIQSGRADDAALAGRASWNMRRIEAGLPWWGVDVTAGENFPKECRLDEVVSYEKGCFLGQETLARMHHRGHPNWFLVGLSPRDRVAGLDALSFPDGEAVAGPEPESVAEAIDALAAPAALAADSQLLSPLDSSKPAKPAEPAGRITSSAFSPKLDKPLFMGYVRTALAAPGTELVLRAGGAESTLVVAPLPLE